MTGSGMSMRFVDKAGRFVDVSQAATQMTDESNQSYPFTPNALLDAALGPQGYYGAFTANMHTDQATTFPSDQLITSALAHGVPVVTGRQMLTWLNGRAGSSYSGISFSGNTLAFTVNVGAGADGLTGMVPTAGPGGTTLTALGRGGSPVSFTRTTIKGVEYAMFLAAPGAHTATYGASAAAPAVTATSVERTSDTATTLDIASTDVTRTEVSYGTEPTKLTRRAVDGTRGTRRTLTLDQLRPDSTYYYQVKVTGPDGRTATSGVETVRTAAVDQLAPTLSDITATPRPDRTVQVTWRTQENTDGALLIGPAPDALAKLYDDERDNRHTLVAAKLRPDTTYHYRVRSVDAAGNATVWPAPSQPPATFVSAGNGVGDLTVAQYRTTHGRSATYLQEDDLGEVSLEPATAAEFSTAALPPAWEAEDEAPGGSTKFSRGKLVLDGERAGIKDTYQPGRTLSLTATFAGPGEQWAGLGQGNGAGNNSRAMFALRNGALQAVVVDRGGEQTIPLSAGLIGTAHVYRIDWTDSGMEFFVDGRSVGSLAGALRNMRPRARDVTADGTPLLVDWMRLSGYAAGGNQVSRVIDAHQMVTWDRLTYQADIPAGTALRVLVRTGSISTPDATWSGWTEVGNGGRVNAGSRYIQYRIDLSTSRSGSSPVLRGIAITNNGLPFDPPTEIKP